MDHLGHPLTHLFFVWLVWLYSLHDLYGLRGFLLFIYLLFLFYFILCYYIIRFLTHISWILHEIFQQGDLHTHGCHMEIKKNRKKRKGKVDWQAKYIFLKGKWGQLGCIRMEGRDSTSGREETFNHAVHTIRGECFQKGNY